MVCICPNFERKHFMASTLCVIPILYHLPAVVSQQHYQRKTTLQINNDVFQFLRLSWGHRCNTYRRFSISSMQSSEGHTYLTANSSLCARHPIQYTQSRLSSAFPFKADSQLSQAIMQTLQKAHCWGILWLVHCKVAHAGVNLFIDTIYVTPQHKESSFLMLPNVSGPIH